MYTVTATELKENFGKYMKLGQSEEICVTLRGKEIFTIVPKNKKLISEWESFFGTLPKEAYDDNEIERE